MTTVSRADVSEHFLYLIRREKHLGAAVAECNCNTPPRIVKRWRAAWIMVSSNRNGQAPSRRIMHTQAPTRSGELAAGPEVVLQSL